MSLYCAPSTTPDILLELSESSNMALVPLLYNWAWMNSTRPTGYETKFLLWQMPYSCTVLNLLHILDAFYYSNYNTKREYK
jgi:hypothetical protein